MPCEESCTLCDDSALLAGLELGLPFDQLGERLDGLVCCQLNKLSRLGELSGEHRTGRDVGRGGPPEHRTGRDVGGPPVGRDELWVDPLSTGRDETWVPPPQCGVVCSWGASVCGKYRSSPIDIRHLEFAGVPARLHMVSSVLADQRWHCSVRAVRYLLTI